MIIVVGAGAAGLVAAIFARTSGQEVTVLESTADGGRKILISGGGRCNVLPQALEPNRFVSDSPAPLVQRLLRSWPLKAQHMFFEQDVGVPLALEAESRKWFPSSNRARDVRDGLVELARRKGVTFEFNTELQSATVSDGRWRLRTSRGDRDARAVVLATGGLSVPATGSTGVGLRLAAEFGHVVHDTYPALTPLVASPARHARLSGVSLDVRIRARSARLEAESHGGFLFTHVGYSGPSVLDVSHVAVRHSARDGSPATVRVRWCELSEAEWHRDFLEADINRGGGFVSTIVARRMPQRLAEQLIAESASRRIAGSRSFVARNARRS